MKEEKNIKHSWIWKWIANSKLATSLLILLLLLINIFMLTKVEFVFIPVGQFLTIVGLPILMSVVIYYMLNPIVDYLEKKGVKRILSIIFLFAVLLGLIIWGIIAVIPRIQEQIINLITNIPHYVRTISNETQHLLDHPMLAQFRPQLTNIDKQISTSIIEWAQGLTPSTFSGLGNFVGAFTMIVIAVITMPFILFFLLKDGKQLLPSVLDFLPIKWRSNVKAVIVDVNTQLSNYIRGQLTVALSVIIMFLIGYSIIGLEYAFTLAIVAGILNMIPYLGSTLAMIPAIILAIVTGPMMLVKVLIVFVIEQTLEGRLISPLVLGNQMAIHPVTIIFVLLTSGKIGGVAGVIVGIPLYAVVKVILTHIFRWYRETSGLYEEETIKEIKNEESVEL